MKKGGGESLPLISFRGENIFISKKGLSDVVATLIVILLVLVAVGIIWVVVQNVIVGGAEQIELTTKCDAVNFQSVRILSVENQAGNYSVNLHRSSGGEEIAGVKVQFFGTEGSSGVLEFGDSLAPLDSKTRIVDTSQGNILTNVNRFDITPYFLSDAGIEQLCPQTRSFSLGALGTGVPLGNGGGNGGNGGNGGGNETTPGEGESCSIDDDCAAGLKCVAEECVPICNGTWEPIYYEVGVYECDGNPSPNGCTAQCLCQTGFTPDESGGCTLDEPINSGIILSVWPEDGSANRFQSEGLPKSQGELVGYTTYSVNFTGSFETRCFGISSAWYYEDVNRSEIGLNIPVGVDLAEINPSEQYNIWEALNCGQ